jgi:hypothetical protein
MAPEDTNEHADEKLSERLRSPLVLAHKPVSGIAEPKPTLPTTPIPLLICVASVPCKNGLANGEECVVSLVVVEEEKLPHHQSYRVNR